MSFFKKRSVAVVVVTGLAGAFLLCMTLLFFTAVLTYRELFTGEMEMLAAMLCSGVGVFCGTIFAAKLRKRQPLLLGFSVGASFLIVCLMVNLGIRAEGTDWSWFLKQGGVCIGCGLLGAVLCAGKNPHARRSRSRR